MQDQTQPEFIQYTAFKLQSLKLLTEDPLHPFHPVYIQHPPTQNELRLQSIYFKSFDLDLVKRAFAVIGKEIVSGNGEADVGKGVGYVGVTALKEMLVGQGEGLNTEEFEDMMNACGDGEKVFVDDYINLLTQV